MNDLQFCGFTDTLWKNNKNQQTYKIYEFLLNCTNSCDGQIIVKYAPLYSEINTLPYCREWEEFKEKFTPQCKLSQTLHWQYSTQNICKYDACWKGACGEKTEHGKEYCSTHEKVQCFVKNCKNHATGDCHQFAGSFICGTPLCNKHKHKHK